MKEEIEKYLSIGITASLRISIEDLKDKEKCLSQPEYEAKDEPSETFSCRVSLSDDEKIGIVLHQTANSFSVERKMSKIEHKKIPGAKDLLENILESEGIINGLSVHINEETEGLEEILPIIKKLMKIDGVGVCTLPAFLYAGRPGRVLTRAIKKEDFNDFIYEIDFKTTVENYVFVYAFVSPTISDNFYIRYEVMKKDETKK